jgi:hypothetical protein
MVWGWFVYKHLVTRSRGRYALGYLDASARRRFEANTAARVGVLHQHASKPTMTELDLSLTLSIYTLHAQAELEKGEWLPFMISLNGAFEGCGAAGGCLKISSTANSSNTPHPPHDPDPGSPESEEHLFE